MQRVGHWNSSWNTLIASQWKQWRQLYIMKASNKGNTDARSSVTKYTGNKMDKIYLIGPCLFCLHPMLELHIKLYWSVYYSRRTNDNNSLYIFYRKNTNILFKTHFLFNMISISREVYLYIFFYKTTLVLTEISHSFQYFYHSDGFVDFK